MSHSGLHGSQAGFPQEKQPNFLRGKFITWTQHRVLVCHHPNNFSNQSITQNSPVESLKSSHHGLSTSLRMVAFTLSARIFRDFSTNHSLPALFFFLFFSVEISLRTLIPLFRPGSIHSGTAS